jgi:hypothetical protein
MILIFKLLWSSRTNLQPPQLLRGRRRRRRGRGRVVLLSNHFQLILLIKKKSFLVVSSPHPQLFPILLPSQRSYWQHPHILSHLHHHRIRVEYRTLTGPHPLSPKGTLWHQIDLHPLHWLRFFNALSQRLLIPSQSSERWMLMFPLRSFEMRSRSSVTQFHGDKVSLDTS